MTTMDMWTGIAAPVGRVPSRFIVAVTMDHVVREHLKEHYCEY
jgi:hypothetical protein